MQALASRLWSPAVAAPPGPARVECPVRRAAGARARTGGRGARPRRARRLGLAGVAGLARALRRPAAARAGGRAAGVGRGHGRRRRRRPRCSRPSSTCVAGLAAAGYAETDDAVVHPPHARPRRRSRPPTLPPGLRAACRPPRRGRGPRRGPPGRLVGDVAGDDRGVRAADGHPAVPSRPRPRRRARGRRLGGLVPGLARPRHGRRAGRAGRVRARPPPAAGSPEPPAWPPSPRPATRAPRSGWSAPAATTATRRRASSTAGSGSPRGADADVRSRPDQRRLSAGRQSPRGDTAGAPVPGVSGAGGVAGCDTTTRPGGRMRAAVPRLSTLTGRPGWDV